MKAQFIELITLTLFIALIGMLVTKSGLMSGAIKAASSVFNKSIGAVSGA